MVLGDRGPEVAVAIERLRRNYGAIPVASVIERVRTVVHGIAKSIDRSPVRQRSREAKLVVRIAFTENALQSYHDLLCRPDRVCGCAGPENGQEYGFRVRRAGAGVVEVIRYQIFNSTPQAPPIANEAVVHEHPAIIGKGMAIQVGDGRRGRRPRMREEKMRANVTAQMAQVLIRPGGPYFMVKPRLLILAIPAQAEPIAVDAGGGFERVEAL